MIEALLLKVVLAAKALLGMGKMPLLLVGKAPLLLLGIVAALALLVTLLLVGLAVTLSLVFSGPFFRARPKPSCR